MKKNDMIIAPWIALIGTALFLALGSPVFAGQSLVLRPGSVVGPLHMTNLAPGNSWRVEFHLHSWAPPTINTTDGNIWDFNALGANASILTNGTLAIYDKRDSVGGGSPCLLTLGTQNNVLVRVQRDTARMSFSCELWNSDGTGYQRNSVAILSFLPWPYSDGGFGSPYTTAQLGFFRIFDSVLSDGSQPPVTADTGNLLELKFDGNLNDSSSAARSWAVSVATFAQTPKQGPAAFLKTLGAPYWADWISLRAGYPAQLDGTRSFSLADVSSAVTYRWQQLSGPTTVRWVDKNGISTRRSPTPVIQGLIFGTYRFRLHVTDLAGNTADRDLEVGAVATDDNHVVIYPDERLYAILGPSIAFGYNPWGYVDYKQYQLEEYWGNQFAIHGGNWAFEPEMTSVNGIPRLGTAYVDAGSNTVNGVGTNFADVFCGGNTANGAPVTTYSYININVPQPGTAPLSYYRYIDHCNGQNQIVMVNGYFWETQPAVPYPGYSWGTIGFCANCGDWKNANNTTSNLNYYDGQGLGNYALYFRSGWEKPHQTAQYVADHWYRNGFAGSPRDWALTSAQIRASIDNTPAPAYDAWPALRNIMSNKISCTQMNATSGQIGDARENGSCLIFRAVQALLDPDPASKISAQNYLTSAYQGTWQAQQQPGGNWVQNVPGGNTTYAIRMSNGSYTGTLVHGPGFPPSLCGEDRARVLNIGSLSVGQDLVTVTGTGIDFRAAGVAPGDVLVGTGTFGGNVRSFVTAIGSVTSSNVLVLSMPWRGDAGNLSFYRIYNGASGGIGGGGLYTQYFVNADSHGNLVFPFTQDSDNFYICSVTNGTTLTLDKPYTGPTSTNPFRLLQTNDLDGPGTQPYMMAFPELGSAIASTALATTNPAVAAGYNTLLSNGANWLWNAAYDPVNGGMWYGYGFTNCLNLKGNLWPAFGCSGGFASQNQDYSVETGVAFARQYLLTKSDADRVRGDTLYNAAYSAPGFPLPSGFNANPNFADLLGCCDGFTLTKYYGQVFALGQAASWPAVRLGGVQPAVTVHPSISFNMATIPGAVSAVIKVTAPSGAVNLFTCASSPCQINADSRQGAHWYQIAYLDGNGTPVAKADPDLLFLQ